ncbi:tetratricopeptide repeat protein [Methanomethylovorans sp.]|uniref:tetratricopeptide repeat protein n=1 Tax=Methanomethylovorans sp. TaxID=2758717 RepID=UPI00351C77CF
MNSKKEPAKREMAVVSQKYVLMGDKETDPGKKEHYYRMALEMEPKNASALNKMGLLFYQKGDHREAIRFFDAVIDLGKVHNLCPIYFNKSMALKALKEYEAALNYISKALTCGSKNPQAEDLKKELQDIVDEKYRRLAEREKQAAYSTSKKEKRYSSWNPPAISILVNMIYYKDWNVYKHRRDFEITDAQKEKVTAKLASKEFCCAVCNFYRSGMCKKKQSMQVDAKAICKAFQPCN